MFRRLEELIRQMSLASRVMGSEDLEQKFDVSLTKVKRGKLGAPLRAGDLATDALDYRYCCCPVVISIVATPYDFGVFVKGCPLAGM